MPRPRIGGDHRHVWMVEQQTGHKYCHWCGEHAPDSKGKCVVAHQLPKAPE